MSDGQLLLEADWLLPVASPPIRDGALLVDGHHIGAVGHAAEFAGWEGQRERHGLVMPGLINCHNHASMTAFRGLADDLPLMEWLHDHVFPAEMRWGDEALVQAAFPVAMAEMLLSGTTCSADMYFFTEESARLAAAAGFRYAPAEGIIDFPTPSFTTVEKALGASRSLLETWAGHPTVHPNVACHAPYTCSPKTLASGHALAAEFAVPWQIHVAETADEVAQIGEKYGATPVRHLESLGLLSERTVCAHAVHVDEEEAAMLAAAGAKVAHNPESNMKLASGLAPIPLFLRQGIDVGLATDGPCSNNDLCMVGEMHTCALVHKLGALDPTAMPAKEALEMATLGSARCLGLADRVGTLEAGKEADLAAFSLDGAHATPVPDPASHLVYAAMGSDCTDVWVRGRRLVENRALATLDLAEARQGLLALTERIHG